LGHYKELKYAPLGLFSRAAEACGDVFRLRVGAAEIVVLRNPDDVKHVLQEHAQNYSKRTRGYRVLRRFLGNGLVTSEGAFWLRQRRIAQPAFHRERIAHFAHLMVRLTQALIARWEEPASQFKPVDVAAEMMALTLDVVGQTLLSTQVREDAGAIGPALTELLRQVRGRALSLIDWPDWVPTGPNRRFRRARGALDAIIYRIIAERRQSGADAHDLLSMLLHARDEETGEGMTDLQLRDELMTIVLAGHETTATALAWTFMLLSQHPACRERLQEELRLVLQERPPTLEDLPRLKYTQAALQEGMRLYPPVWVLLRHAERDDVLGGHQIRAGNYVACAQWVVHRNPKVFERPEAFEPERFLGERGERIPRFAYFPFSGGPRVCIGNNFAMMEGQLVLASIAQRYRLELLPKFVADPEPTVTLRPRHGLPMTLLPVGRVEPLLAGAEAPRGLAAPSP
jgi:cytochrome P450